MTVPRTAVLYIPTGRPECACGVPVWWNRIRDVWVHGRGVRVDSSGVRTIVTADDHPPVVRTSRYIAVVSKVFETDDRRWRWRLRNQSFCSGCRMEYEDAKATRLPLRKYQSVVSFSCGESLALDGYRCARHLPALSEIVPVFGDATHYHETTGEGEGSSGPVWWVIEKFKDSVIERSIPTVETSYSPMQGVLTVRVPETIRRAVRCAPREIGL